jgi:hypothetical protein
MSNSFSVTSEDEERDSLTAFVNAPNRIFITLAYGRPNQTKTIAITASDARALAAHLNVLADDAVSGTSTFHVP